MAALENDDALRQMISLAAKHHWTLDKVQDMPEMEYWCWIAHHVKEEEAYQQTKDNKNEI